MVQLSVKFLSGPRSQKFKRTDLCTFLHVDPAHGLPLLLLQHPVLDVELPRLLLDLLHNLPIAATALLPGFSSQLVDQLDLPLDLAPHLLELLQVVPVQLGHSSPKVLVLRLQRNKEAVRHGAGKEE